MKTLAMSFLPGVANRQSGTAQTRPSLLARITTWHRVARERRRLLDVDPRLLTDMGLTPEDAAHEASRPFWDIDTWR